MSDPTQTSADLRQHNWEEERKDLAERLKASYEAMKAAIYEKGCKAGVASVTQGKEAQS